MGCNTESSGCFNCHCPFNNSMFELIDLQLFAQVQIIEEEAPLHVPRDAFSHLATVPTFHSGKVPRAAATSPLPYEHSDDEAGLQADVDDFEDSESDSGPEEDRLLRR
jgi:cereblon